MASSIVGVNKSRAQLLVLMEYGDAKRLKLRKNNCWEFTGGSKRERTEIVAEILSYCSQHKNKTYIMYTVNLNYA
jgi:hypothetical protein